jgi:hypothetical protein
MGALRFDFQLAQTWHEMVFDGVGRVEEAFVEVLRAQFVPHVLNGVEFRRVRRQESQPHVRRRSELVAGVPAGAVQDRDDVVVGVLPRHLVD